MRLIILFLSILSSINAQSSCKDKMSCSDCIQTKNCAWCSKPDLNETLDERCFEQNLSSCPANFMINPMSFMTELQNFEKIKSGNDSLPESDAQLRPQKISLELRVEEKLKVKVTYKQMKDYPVDLYFLMDLSNSMKDDKDKLSLLGDSLAKTMRNITSNFRLGFGSFVDKVIMPFVSTVPKKLREPCKDCARPYSFRNHMKLSEKTEEFADHVKQANVSGNIDNPEGGFDATIQAIVCNEEIGWRAQARKLIVFTTDSGFHTAGDGKLAGIIAPNDGKCHMKDDMYTHAEIQDYPSIPQINLNVKKHSVNIIFAVTNDQLLIYKKLSKRIEGSSCAELKADSSNVVELIRDEYNKISSSIELRDNLPDNNIKITYRSKCLKGEMKETKKCDGLKVGSEVSFEAEVKLTSCPRDPRKQSGTFKIYPVGINEVLTVDLKMLCSCGCEKSEKNSNHCNKNGFLSCGICECNTGFSGRSCECSSSSHGSTSTSSCRPNNETAECNGRGRCDCNQCVCDSRGNADEIINGRFCECDNFSCLRSNSMLCSGPAQGECKCGKCECKEGWEGPSCACQTSNHTCIGPNGKNGQVCSGHGSCQCGKCECESTEDAIYTGTYCESCPTCPGRCDEEKLKDCVECSIYQKGKLRDNCADNCESYAITAVDTDEYDDETEHHCQIYDEGNCRYQFFYSKTHDGVGPLPVKAQKNQECPPKIEPLRVVFSVVGSILLIGIITLLVWKCLTSYYDQMEYKKFVKEQSEANWPDHQNPLFQGATQSFKNPTYGG